MSMDCFLAGLISFSSSFFVKVRTFYCVTVLKWRVMEFHVYELFFTKHVTCIGTTVRLQASLPV